MGMGSHFDVDISYLLLLVWTEHNAVQTFLSQATSYGVV